MEKQKKSEIIIFQGCVREMPDEFGYVKDMALQAYELWTLIEIISLDKTCGFIRLLPWEDLLMNEESSYIENKEVIQNVP